MLAHSIYSHTLNHAQMVQINSSLWIGYGTWGLDLKLFAIGCLILRIHFLICRIECSSWTIVITKKTMIKYCVDFNQWNKYLPRTDLFFWLEKLRQWVLPQVCEALGCIPWDNHGNVSWTKKKMKTATWRI